MSSCLYLPIANASVHLYLLVALGMLVGFCAGMFGVGGGFLMTPLLIMIGLPPTVAAATDSNQIVAATMSGTWAHWRHGNVDVKMGTLLLIGGVIGGTAGVQLIHLLRASGEADFVIKAVYVLMLGFIGSYMLVESIHSMRRGSRQVEENPVPRDTWFEKVDRRLPFAMDFPKSHVSMSMLMPLSFGGLVGVLAALLGIGGGFIMIPVMIYILRMPMHVAVGTNLFQELFICINVTFMQAWSNHTVDFPLALILLAGSTVGAQVGARVGNRLKADQLKILLAVLVLLVMAKILLSLVLKPHLILTIAGGR